MISTMKILHKFEVFAILFLLMISAVEGVCIVKLAQKSPQPAIVVVEDTNYDLPDLPTAKLKND